MDLVAAERLEGREVLVCATHAGTRDITARRGENLALTSRSMAFAPRLETHPYDKLVLLPHPLIGCLHQLVESVGRLRCQVRITLQVG